MLGNWLRARFGFVAPGPAIFTKGTEGGETEIEGEAQARGAASGDGVDGRPLMVKVMVVAVTVFVVLLVKRPIRFATVAGAAAAASSLLSRGRGRA